MSEHKLLAAVALALPLGLLPLAPARAALGLTIPLHVDNLDWGLPGQGVTATGGGVTVLWFGGHRGKLSGEIDLGYAYLKDPAQNSYNFLTSAAQARWGLPLGPIFPYIGGVARYWYALSEPRGLHGNPSGIGPEAGVEFNLGTGLSLGFNASFMRLAGLSNAQGPVPADLSELTGQIQFSI